MVGTGQTSQSPRRSELCVFRAIHVEALPGLIPTPRSDDLILELRPQPAKKKAKKEESEEEAVASAEEQHYSEAEAEEEAKPALKKRKVRPLAGPCAPAHNSGTPLTPFDRVCLDRLPRRPRRRSLLRTLTRPRRRRSLLTRSPQRRRRRWVLMDGALFEGARECMFEY